MAQYMSEDLEVGDNLLALVGLVIARFFEFGLATTAVREHRRKKCRMLGERAASALAIGFLLVRSCKKQPSALWMRPGRS